MFHINKETGTDIIYGGWFLGGGGGGTLEGGLGALDAALALGGFNICSVDEIDPECMVLTASLVGSPSMGGVGVTPEHCRKAYDLYERYTGTKVGAFLANEAGAHSITNGWIAAAATGCPVIDGACNGRAHPTGVMGAMGLETEKGYRSVQIAVGGSDERYTELCETGSIEGTSKLVREASVQCGGFISVLRNPVAASYVRKNAAIGTLTMCEKVGKAIRTGKDGESVIKELVEGFGLRLHAKGRVCRFELSARGGFDVGTVHISDGSEVTFWNEYMTAEKDGKRLATFPDLITLLDAGTGAPLCSASLWEGMEVMLVSIPKENLILGEAMRHEALFLPCEEAIGKKIISYSFVTNG